MSRGPIGSRFYGLKNAVMTVLFEKIPLYIYMKSRMVCYGNAVHKVFLFNSL